MSKRTSIFLLIALAISVAVNLFILGAAGYYGAQFKGFARAPDIWADRAMLRGERRFLRHLEGNDRVIAKDIFAMRRPHLRDSVRAMHIARLDFMRIMRDTPDDSGALKSAIDRSQQAARIANENFHGTLRDLATQLSPEAIKQLGHGMRHRRDRRNNDYD